MFEQWFMQPFSAPVSFISTWMPLASVCNQTCWPVTSEMYAADGQQVVVAAGARVFVYDLQGNPVQALKGHTVGSLPRSSC
jgi:hypothetical protein